MKCAVFWIMAFSGFKTFLAQQFDDDLVIITGKFVDDMVGILISFNNDIDNEGKAVGIHTKGYTHPGGCTESATNALDRFFNLTMDVHEPCTDDATKNKDSQSAQSCCDTAVNELNKNKKIVYDKAKTCLQKCAKKAPDCNKEIQNLDALATKNSKM